MTKTLRDAISAQWREAPYYELVEKRSSVEFFWASESTFRRLFATLDLDHVLELACGWGRHSQEIVDRLQPGHITLVDVNETNMEVCRKRFGTDSRFTFVLTSGSDLSGVAPGSVSAVFCYDAMVHFEYDDVFAYLREIFRVLRPGGRALLHHSNNDRQPGNLCHENVHWRNFMSASLFKHVAMRTGFELEDQILMNWGKDPDPGDVTWGGQGLSKEIDALSLLKKPMP